MVIFSAGRAPNDHVGGPSNRRNSSRRANRLDARSSRDGRRHVCRSNNLMNSRPLLREEDKPAAEKRSAEEIS